MPRRWIVPVLACVALAAPLAAKEWIVATDGDDAKGDGSSARPFRSVGRVLDTSIGVVSDGDTVTLRTGTYSECDVRLRKQLTLRGQPGERAHIHCDPATHDSVVVQIDPSASGSRVSGLELSGAAYYGIKLESYWSRGNPSERGASGIVLEDLRIHDTGRDGIKLTPHCDDVVIRRSEIWNTGAIDPPGTPLEQRNAEGIDNVGGHRLRVEDNFLHDIATTGLYVKGGATGAIVQRNRIENTGSGGILIGFHTDEEFFDAANPDYHESIDAVVRNNLVRGTDYAGIGLYSAKNTLVANNTIVNAARRGHAAIFFGIPTADGFPKPRQPSIGARVRNNLVVESAGDCVAIRWQAGGEARGVRARVAEFVERHVAAVGSGIAALQGNPDFDYNAYDAACRFRDERPPQPVAGAVDFAAWREREHAEAHGISAVLRVDADGRLPADSPARASGLALEAVRDDLQGRARSARPDIGAMQSAAAK